VEIHESIFRELNKQFGLSEGIEMLLRHLDERREAEPAREPQAENHIQEEKFAEPRRAPEPIFRDTPTADVLHH
jgi:hypothetical protein